MSFNEYYSNIACVCEAHCRLFRDTIDNRLTSTWLRCYDGQSEQCLTGFLQRLQQQLPTCLEAVAINGLINGVSSSAIYCVDSLLKHLHSQLTALTIYGWVESLAPLKQLQHLTTLVVGKHDVYDYGDWVGKDEVKDLTHITGLKRLESVSPLGSVAHLAPTLKHLSTWEYSDVDGLSCLTNLEVLEILCGIPTDCSDTLSRLPLKHLSFQAHPGWTLHPLIPALKTLTQVTLRHGFKGILLLEGLPACVTCLKLLEGYPRDIRAVAAALPGLRALHLRIEHEPSTEWNEAFNHLSELTNLHTLGLCMSQRHACPDEDTVEKDSNARGSCCTAWDRDRILAELPNVAKAVERGVKLIVMADKELFLGVLSHPCAVKSLWAMDG